MVSFSSMSGRTLEQLKIPLYERIRIDIQTRLIEQRWDPAQPIPSEQALAAEYDVSIGTVRRAIERLVQEGLLYKAQGRGTFIRQPDFKKSLLRFFRYRNRSGKPVVPIGVIKKIKSIAPDPAINPILQLDAETPLIQLKRIRLVEGEVALSEQIWLPQPDFAPLLEFAPSEIGNLLYPFYYEHCGQFIFSAKETLSLTSEHADAELGITQGQPVIQIERIAYNLATEPVEYRVSFGQPENFKYEVHIS